MTVPFAVRRPLLSLFFSRPFGVSWIFYRFSVNGPSAARGSAQERPRALMPARDADERTPIRLPRVYSHANMKRLLLVALLYFIVAETSKRKSQQTVLPHTTNDFVYYRLIWADAGRELNAFFTVVVYAARFLMADAAISRDRINYSPLIVPLTSNIFSIHIFRCIHMYIITRNNCLLVNNNIIITILIIYDVQKCMILERMFVADIRALEPISYS